MLKATDPRGRSTSSRSSRARVSDTSDGRPDLGDIAEQICATAYIDGKTQGVFAATFTVLAKRLSISEQTLNLAVAAGISRGWLRQGANRVELTAAGIYVGKLTLKLPT
jgi:hypothetical protein